TLAAVVAAATVMVTWLTVARWAVAFAAATVAVLRALARLLASYRLGGATVGMGRRWCSLGRRGLRICGRVVRLGCGPGGFRRRRRCSLGSSRGRRGRRRRRLRGFGLRRCCHGQFTLRRVGLGGRGFTHARLAHALFGDVAGVGGIVGQAGIPR